jgi:hypothetical protein
MELRKTISLIENEEQKPEPLTRVYYEKQLAA